MREISKAMKRARGRRSINLNKRRLKAAWYSRQGSTGVGGSNWQSPSFDPDRSWLYVVARDHSQGYRSAPVVFEEGRQYIGGVPFPAGDAAGGANRNFVLAIDTTTGEVMWKYPIVRGSFAAGVLSTGGGIVFAATAAGDLVALDSGSGKPLWFFQTGARIASSPISYSVDGKQSVAIAAGNVLYSLLFAIEVSKVMDSLIH